jgi:TPP-dependent pyruvate/acetoin dehydrogenase alpha subunit
MLTTAQLSTEQLTHVYRQMVRIRTFEERTQALFLADKYGGSTHMAIGQEAISVGTRLALRDGDLVAPSYRGHAWALAWGLGTYEAFCEQLGRADAPSAGHGGSKHFSSARLGVLPGNAIVGAQVPIACGAALRAKLDEEDDVTVAAFGDGATNQGAFHEAANLASIWDLPVILVCENNLYSEMSAIRDMTRVDDLAVRATSYGMPGETVDGMSVSAVYDAVSRAADRARSGHGPTFLEMKTYRYCGHMPGDSEIYRSADEVTEWRARDPLEACRRDLLAGGMTEVEVDGIMSETKSEVAESEARALAAALPGYAELELGSAPWMVTKR